jgi:predicted RNA binding protein YcfA (HicA-like mRNA interferase family)
MTRLPTLKSSVMIAFLLQLGFKLIRQKGSHKFFRHTDGRTATVPDHKGEDLGRGITRKILKDIEATEDDLLNWLKKR